MIGEIYLLDYSEIQFTYKNRDLIFFFNLPFFKYIFTKKLFKHIQYNL